MSWKSELKDTTKSVVVLLVTSHWCMNCSEGCLDLCLSAQSWSRAIFVGCTGSQSSVSDSQARQSLSEQALFCVRTQHRPQLRGCLDGTQHYISFILAGRLERQHSSKTQLRSGLTRAGIWRGAGLRQWGKALCLMHVIWARSEGLRCS